jgi:hypothetical protein
MKIRTKKAFGTKRFKRFSIVRRKGMSKPPVKLGVDKRYGTNITVELGSKPPVKLGVDKSYLIEKERTS